MGRTFISNGQLEIDTGRTSDLSSIFNVVNHFTKSIGAANKLMVIHQLLGHITIKNHQSKSF
jgi:hypothetical protein